MKYIYTMIYCLMLMSCGASKNSTFVIDDSFFISDSDIDSEIRGLKISTLDQVNEFKLTHQNEKLVNYLDGKMTLIGQGSFFYITVNSELVEINKRPGIDVAASVLSATNKKGYWVYVIEGDPNVPIKAALLSEQINK